jgi:hypothetical protein
MEPTWIDRICGGRMKTSSKIGLFFLIILVFSLAVVFMYQGSGGQRPSQQEKPLSVYHEPNITSVEVAPKTFLAPTQPVTKPKKRIVAEQDTAGVDDLPLPHPTTLSQKEEEKAVSFFASQRDGWLSMRFLTANYKARKWLIEDGNFVECDDKAMTGKIYAKTVPFDRPPAEMPFASVEIPVHLYSDQFKCHLMKESITGPKFRKEIVYWADDSNAEIDKPSVKSQAWDYVRAEWIFEPLIYLSQLYRDEKWQGAGLTREQFFADRGVPLRRSSEDETKNLFGGEPQYLFVPSRTFDDQIWVSATTGEIRHISVQPAERKKRVHRIQFCYYDYIKDKDGRSVFPTRFVFAWDKGQGKNLQGGKLEVELTNVELNHEISPDVFKLPKN